MLKGKQAKLEDKGIYSGFVTTNHSDYIHNNETLNYYLTSNLHYHEKNDHIYAAAFSSSCMLRPANQSIKQVNERGLFKKSINKRSAGWIMLVGGTLVGLIGASLPSDQIGPSDEGAVMILIGGASMIGSIPFFISSGINRRKARNASANFKFQKCTILLQE